MSTKILKPLIFTMAASMLSLANIGTANAKPGFCKPAVTTTVGCIGCHTGKPSIASYRRGACQKAAGGGNTKQPGMGTKPKPPVKRPGMGTKPKPPVKRPGAGTTKPKPHTKRPSAKHKSTNKSGGHSKKSRNKSH